MKLIKVVSLSAVANAIRIVNGLVVAKLIAIYIGPSGLALIGQFQNFMSIVTTLASGAINTGVVKYTAEYVDDVDRKSRIWSAAIAVSLLPTVLLSVVILFNSIDLSEFIFEKEEFSDVFVILSLTLVFYVLNSLLIAILNGQSEIKKLVLVNISSSVFSLALTGYLAVNLGLHGALISLATSQTLVFIVTFAFVAKSHWFRVSLFFSGVSSEYVKKLLNFSFMAIVATSLAPICQMIIRNYIGGNIGWEQAGYWESVNRISSVYLGFITATLSIYYLPKISSIKGFAHVKKEIYSGLRLILPTVSLLSLFIFLLRDHVIIILFTEQFIPMRELFGYQMIGDVVKIASWLFSYVFVAKAMTKVFVITELLYWLCNLLSSIIFINKYGVEGATMAYACTYLLYFIMVIYVFYRCDWKEKI